MGRGLFDHVRMWDTLHTVFGGSSGTLSTVMGQVHRLTATCGRDYHDDGRSNKFS